MKVVLSDYAKRYAKRLYKQIISIGKTFLFDVMCYLNLSQNNIWNMRKILAKTSHCVLVMSVTWWYVHFYSMASETKIIDDSCCAKKPFKSESFQGTDILNILLMFSLVSMKTSFEALVNISLFFIICRIIFNFTLQSILCHKFHYQKLKSDFS